MKRLLPFLLLAAATAAHAKEPALLELPPDSWNFYFQPQMLFTEIKGDNANFAGAEIGACLNERVDFALAANVLINDLDLNNPRASDPHEGQVWDAGALVEYHFDPCLLIECSLQLYLGRGRVDVGNKTDGNDADTDFLLVEPSLNIGVNLTQSLVLGAGVGYRFASGSDSGSAVIRDEELRNVTGVLFLRFDEF